MSTAKQIQYTAEEQARIEIRNFVNDGLRDLQKGNVQNFDEAFDEINFKMTKLHKHLRNLKQWVLLLFSKLF